MKRFLLLACVAAVAVCSVWSQNVDERELKSVGEPDIVFESYTGAHSVFDTAEEIVGIGRALALSLRADGRRGEFFGLYSVIRAVDPAETRKLNADLIVFEDKAGVDHIRNVRRIIAGYVETAFGYSRADAELLAVFVTYYNAVYRGKLADLSDRYSSAVMANLSAENAGIALSYREWPGKTRLIIPHARAGFLPAGSPGAKGAGQPGVVSTTELTERRVVEQLRSEPDRGLADRKAMVELKEREVETGRGVVAAEEKRIAEEKTVIAKREEPLEIGTPAPAARAAAAGTDAGAGTVAHPAGTGTGGSPETRAAAEEKAKVVEAEKRVEETKAVVAAKEAEIARDREGIVTDEKATPVTPAAAEPAVKPAVSENVLYLAGRGSAGGGRLLVIDPVTRSTAASSAVGGIASLDYYYFKESVVVLAREGAEVRLALLDAKTLAVAARGMDPMYAGSYVHAQAGAIYAVTLQGGGARLGKYDGTLARTAMSVEPVDRDTYVRIFGDEVYVSSPDGTIMVLSAADLSRKGQVAAGGR
jgi:hypothetical protein